jgi:ATP-dependent DNA ligase
MFCYPPKPTSTHTKPPDEAFYELAKLSPNFVIEKKKNGFACVIVKKGDDITFYTREKKPLNLSIIPEASEQFKRLSLPENIVLGGEAIGRRTIIKDVLYLYAVYYAGDEWLMNASLKENRDILKSIIKPTKNIEIAEYYREKDCPGGRFDKYYFEHVNRDDIEGVILKDEMKPVKYDFSKSLILPYWFKFKSFDC